MKNLFKSKRFWLGLIGLVTITSMIFTGEKTLQEQLPLIIADGFAFVQLVIGVISTKPLELGGKPLIKATKAPDPYAK